MTPHPLHHPVHVLATELAAIHDDGIKYHEVPSHIRAKCRDAAVLIEALFRCARDNHDYRNSKGAPAPDPTANYRVCATCGTDGSFDR